MTFRWIYGANGRDACHSVRKKVFVEEQAFTEALVFDGIDPIAWHLCVEEDGRVVGAARLFADSNGDYHCGRICTLPEYRGKGLGLWMMARLEEKAKELGASRLQLSAQVRVRDFYEKAGYQAFGEVYYDEYCPHVSMKKTF